MKKIKLPVTFAVAFILSVLIAGCSSSDSTSPMSDPVDGAGDDSDGELPSATIINQQGYQALLHSLLPIVDGTRLDALSDELIATIDSLGDSDSSLPTTLVDSGFDTETQLQTSNYTCDAGGSVIVKIVARLTEYDFDQCVLNESTYDGSVSTRFDRDESEIIFTGFDVVSPNRNMQLEGTIQAFNSASAFYQQSQNISFVSARVTGEDAVDVTDFLLSIAATDNDGQTAIERSFDTDLTIGALLLGAEGQSQSLEVQTTQALTGTQPDDFYSSGTITVTASDGSSMLINAENGDPITVQVTVNAAGATFADTLNWDDLVRLACLDNTSTGSEPQFACGS